MVKIKNKYNIGDKFTNENGSNYLVVGFKTRVRKGNYDKKQFLSYYYKLRCLKCDCEFWTRQDHINRKCYCESINRPKVVDGVNDIPTVAPWMIEYFQGGYEEAKKYSFCSNKRVVFKCPHCKRLSKPMLVYDLYNHHNLNCICNDNISFPEKFFWAFLDYLNIDYDFQVGARKFNFLKGKYKYDFYIPKYDCIIETHGRQHYETCMFDDIKNQKLRDQHKRRLAVDNGVTYYIELDCRESELKWIKKSIMNSQLPKILSFTEDDIDWVHCYEQCMSNKVKEICDYYMKTMLSTVQIAKKMNYGYAFIKNALLKGDSLGWCVYATTKARPKPTKIYNDEEMILFKSVADIVKQSKNIFGKYIDIMSINHCYIKYNKPCNGYYIETITDPKEKCIALYGNKAVKWYEEHQKSIS